MTVYYLTILAVFVFSLLAINNENTTNVNIITKKTKSQKICLFCVAAVLIFVAGLRYYVGTDYGGYYKIFNGIDDKFFESLKEFDEPGFLILAKLLSLFTTEGAVFIFITAAFTIGSILFVTYKYTDTYMFSSLLFIFVGIWDGSFNGVRQYFAAAIICLGHRFILEKKFWKYLLFVFIAFLFHSSAIVMIIPYFILRNKISFINILILTIGSIILLYNYEFIFSIVGLLKDETMDATEGTYLLNQVNVFRVVVGVVPAVFSLLLYFKSEKNAEQTFYINILVLYALLGIVGMNSPYLSRVTIYLSALLPLAFGKLIIFRDRKTEIIAKWVIVLLFFAFWYYGVSKSADLNNFKWIWQR